ncbi:hypothetical protein SGPA1_22035 [Streptomyces misionensis JCM 4497]
MPGPRLRRGHLHFDQHVLASVIPGRRLGADSLGRRPAAHIRVRRGGTGGRPVPLGQPVS